MPISGKLDVPVLAQVLVGLPGGLSQLSDIEATAPIDPEHAFRALPTSFGLQDLDFDERVVLRQGGDTTVFSGSSRNQKVVVGELIFGNVIIHSKKDPVCLRSWPYYWSGEGDWLANPNRFLAVEFLRDFRPWPSKDPFDLVRQ
ncbi:hypothetical protein DL93DRAFT_2103170 [Clavulina sp. PMI_390]|nr:hypothetical protein DL93DRAFT_2103170 [Clavulina sp. PMI_390]